MAMFFSEPLTWPEAEAAFADRVAMPSEVFRELVDELKGIAWTVARITEHQVMLRVKRKLEQVIERGETLAVFRKWLGADAIGWTSAYTELVFRMAVLGSYSKARWEEINDPDLGDEFGWLMYDAVNDDRTRKTHAALDGKAWEKDEFPDEWYPPNGYNCRCEVRNLNDDLMRRAGADPQTEPPAEDPDDGFQANQAKDYSDILEDELSRLRDELGG